MKSLWNRESWDKVTKEYRVGEKSGESKEIQRNREVMRTDQEKGIGQELRTTKVGHAFFILDRPEKNVAMKSNLNFEIKIFYFNFN